MPQRRPQYRDWEDFLARTTAAERRAWCAAKRKVANRWRLMSGEPTTRITGAEVWTILERARGRCHHCGSLAVEHRPSDPKTGAPLPWAHVGRRVGSLEHLTPRCGPHWEGLNGSNEVGNLAWACLWCNTWESERRKGALDHGGYYPRERRTERDGRASATKGKPRRKR